MFNKKPKTASTGKGLVKLFPRNKESTRSEVHSSPSKVSSLEHPVETPTATVETIVPAIPIVHQEQEKSDNSPKRVQSSIVASDILLPFIGVHLNYEPRKTLNSYLPCALKMDFFLNSINYNLVDNFYFKRHAPDYHPYILRLYYGVVFWIQCLRAGHSVSALPSEQHQFLTRFLENFPPSSLHIVGPLIPLFKTISSSQPEIPTYARVYPRLPTFAGPRRRDAFFRTSISWAILPNIPGIFALLEHLNGTINAEQPRFPRKGGHIPVTATATQPIIFGHHSFPIPATRSEPEKWSLVSSGLQYPCEADAKLNEAFAERYSHFKFPPTDAADDLRSIANFMSMDRDFSWFSKVKNVALSAALFFEGSGTLADCDPTSCAANQVVVKVQAPKRLPTAPTKSADEASAFPFVFRLSSSARGLPHLEEVMAAMAQTNVHMFSTHPALAALDATTLRGDFWDIRPIEQSRVNSSAHLLISDFIKRMMKDRI